MQHSCNSFHITSFLTTFSLVHERTQCTTHSSASSAFQRQHILSFSTGRENTPPEMVLGKLGPGQLGPRTVGPRTVGPPDSWAPDSWAPGQLSSSSAAGPDGPTAELLLTLLTPALEILILRYFDTRIPDTFDQRLRRPQWTSLLPPTYNYCTGFTTATMNKLPSYYRE